MLIHRQMLIQIQFRQTNKISVILNIKWRMSDKLRLQIFSPKYYNNNDSHYEL